MEIVIAAKKTGALSRESVRHLTMAPLKAQDTIRFPYIQGLISAPNTNFGHKFDIKS